MFKINISALFVIFIVNCSLSVAIISTHQQQDKVFSARQLGQSIAQCFGKHNLVNCLENEIFKTLDKAIANNETWHLSDFLLIEKNPSTSSYQEESIDKLHGRTLSDTLALKLLQLARTRSLKLQLPSSVNTELIAKRSISSTLDDFNTLDVDEKEESSENAVEQEEGRKKKYKDKNMAMVGGMAMIAMVAQMFLGKVILIAGAAFVMAKIALLISVLSQKGNEW